MPALERRRRRVVAVKRVVALRRVVAVRRVVALRRVVAVRRVAAARRATVGCRAGSVFPTIDRIGDASTWSICAGKADPGDAALAGAHRRAGSHADRACGQGLGRQVPEPEEVDDPELLNPLDVLELEPLCSARSTGATARGRRAARNESARGARPSGCVVAGGVLDLCRVEVFEPASTATKASTRDMTGKLLRNPISSPSVPAARQGR